MVTAADGEEGLRLAGSESPDLVLLDMLMPKMTGLEALRAIRASEPTRDLRVLILSNSSREQDMAEAASLGVLGYIVKSNVSLQELCDQIAALVGNPT